MKVTPLAGPAPVQATTTNNTEARARAIAALTGQSAGTTQGNQQAEAVANPNQISPEEMSAVKAPQTTETIDKSTISEETIQEAPKVDPETQRKFEEITRQERLLRAKANKQAADLKAAQDALNAREAALAEREKKLDPSRYIERSRVKADTLGLLAEEGIDYNTLTEQLISQSAKDPRVEAQISRLEQTIRNLEVKLDINEKSQTEQRATEYQNALKQIERDTVALVKADSETYEAIAKTNSHKAVVELIEREYKASGNLLSIEEAAQEVENYLVEESVNQVSRIDKIKKRLEAANASTAKAKPQEQKTQANNAETNTMKTLTNAQASSRKLSARERALLAFKGELK